MSGYAATMQETQGQPVNPPGAVQAHNVPDFSDLVAKVKPAVVSITSKLGPAGDENDEEGRDALARSTRCPARGRTPRIEARGSGFIVDPTANRHQQPRHQGREVGLGEAS